MILHAHPTGNANVRALVRYWHETGRLARFVTTIGVSAESTWPRVLPTSLVEGLGRRTYPVPTSKMVHRPLRESVRLVAGRVGLPFVDRHESGWASVDAVYRDLDRFVADGLSQRWGEVEDVYLYEDGACASFSVAAERPITRHYDLPTGYWRAKRSVLEREKERNPEWASTLTGDRDGGEKLARKDRELALADHVVVASTFTRRTLEEAPDLDAPVSVVPYGAPAPGPRVRPYTRNGPLRVLFVGALSQQKGLSYFFEAVECLREHVEVTVVGRARRRCRSLDRALRAHRWIPGTSHERVLALMGAHDVLVFPTLFDGFGLVVTEALSRGTPVIGTSACAVPDLITDGEEGFVVPPASADAIEASLVRLIRDRERLVTMGRRARRLAERSNWTDYAEGVTRSVETVVSSYRQVDLSR